MSKSAARKLVNKRRLGNGWVVSVYSDRLGWVESREMTYWEACEVVRSSIATMMGQ